MEKLVALVPRPRINLIRFLGVLAPNAKARSKVIPKPELVKKKDSHLESDKKEYNIRQKMNWSRRLKKVFDIDISVCPNCQGQLKIVSTIEDPQVVKKILVHLKIPSEAPKISGPRAPPDMEDSTCTLYNPNNWESQLPPNR